MKIDNIIVQITELRNAEQTIKLKQNGILNTLDAYLKYININDSIKEWKIIEDGEILINDYWIEGINVKRHAGIRVTIEAVDSFIEQKLNKGH